MSMQVRVEYNHIPATMRAIEKRADHVTKAIATSVKNNAQFRAPVRTGNLKRSIYVEHTGHNQYMTIADTKHHNPALRSYAEYVERGTYEHHAQPYMFPGYIATRATTVPTQIALYAAYIEMAARTGRA